MQVVNTGSDRILCKNLNLPKLAGCDRILLDAIKKGAIAPTKTIIKKL
ncbi:hypothetical protein [Coleofasciculus sp. FACHB-SPT36]|nr:hypothetical protein [Coleofasciculus sp. FACHB-SPT36]MBD2542200.1 hypothetical protein [Coleofasciculus sp. FACHB-SPT36]